jgi:iron complex outermembrane recepter protein
MYMDPMTLRKAVLSLCALLLALPAGGVAGQPASDPDVTGSIIGEVVDRDTGAPVSAAHVRLRELRRSELSHADGTFHFEDIPAGRYTVSAERLGYSPVELRIDVGDGEIARPRLEMQPSALRVAGVVVTGTGRARGAGETYRPTSVLQDAELRRRLESSVAATIAHEPGINMRYNGPAAAQPVIRGMSGDRILVLEDGQRTGDMATTAPDHAVAIDPLTAERIEVVRGPAGLLYGSNALGGVINVIREEVPRTVPEALSATFSAQAESVNRGMTTGGALTIPIAGRFALRTELSGRTASDTRTPLGTLESTAIRGYNGGMGVSLVSGWGYAGLAGRISGTSYGVPGEFAGDTIPGAHAGGVDIEMERRTLRVEAGHFAGLGPFRAIDFDAQVVHYQHDEIEGETAAGQTIVGASFDRLSLGGNLRAHHEHEANGWLLEGAAGISAHHRDLITGGRFPGSRSARETNLAGYVYEELGLGTLRLEAGARYDWTRIEPADRRPIEVGDRVIPIEPRSFGSASGSLAALTDLGRGVTLGAGISRAFRTPAIEELFSDGPHLADFSFDIGNPELDPEVGHGVDVFARLDRARLSGELTLFANRVRNFIYYEPSGERDPRLDRFPVFQARGDDARFLGGEAAAQWEFIPRWVLDGVASYVRAERTADGDPLPGIPPLDGAVRTRYEGPAFFASAELQAAARQNRVPRAFASPIDPDRDFVPERPTAGYGLVNLGAGWRWTRGQALHTVTLQVDNAFDQVWRDHLSRIKEVAPQPGRNIQLLYRVAF